MDRAQITGYLGKDWTAVIDLIHKALDSDIDLLNSTNKALLGHAGKMMRPMLSLLMARACGGACTEASIRYAAAVELLHNATLLHDDVADESDTRRGHPTVNALLGSRASVLIGDFWLVRAVDQILGKGASDSIVIRLFSKTLSDLAEGEMLQLQKAAKADTCRDDYIRIIYSKTASLFEVACLSAAISVGSDESTLAIAKDYAYNLGVAFQIKDDLMDYSSEAIGKPVGVDLKEHKITLPLLCALESADEQSSARIRAMVATLDGEKATIDEILGFVKGHDGLAKAREVLSEYGQKAENALAGLPESEARQYLIQLARFTVDRNI